jgi:hypothetical protein
MAFDRKFIYRKNEAVLVETEEQFNELKEFYNADRAEDNSKLHIMKFHEAKKLMEETMAAVEEKPAKAPKKSAKAE